MADAGAAFREHYPRLYRYLVHLTGDGDAAADIAQESFARLVRETPPPDRPRPWLFRVAHNLVRETERTRARRRRLLAGAPERATMGDPAPSPDRQAERLEAVARLREALASPSERDRMILLMRHEGFRHHEIAEAAGTTTGSVGTMIVRAMDRLARRLELDEDEA